MRSPKTSQGKVRSEVSDPCTPTNDKISRTHRRKTSSKSSKPGEVEVSSDDGTQHSQGQKSAWGMLGSRSILHAMAQEPPSATQNEMTSQSSLPTVEEAAAAKDRRRTSKTLKERSSARDLSQGLRPSKSDQDGQDKNTNERTTVGSTKSSKSSKSSSSRKRESSKHHDKSTSPDPQELLRLLRGMSNQQASSSHLNVDDEEETPASPPRERTPSPTWSETDKPLSQPFHQRPPLGMSNGRGRQRENRHMYRQRHNIGGGQSSGPSKAELEAQELSAPLSSVRKPPRNNHRGTGRPSSERRMPPQMHSNARPNRNAYPNSTHSASHPTNHETLESVARHFDDMKRRADANGRPADDMLSPRSQAYGAVTNHVSSHGPGPSRPRQNSAGHGPPFETPIVAGVRDLSLGEKNSQHFAGSDVAMSKQPHSSYISTQNDARGTPSTNPSTRSGLGQAPVRPIPMANRPMNRAHRPELANMRPMRPGYRSTQPNMQPPIPFRPPMRPMQHQARPVNPSLRSPPNHYMPPMNGPAQRPQLPFRSNPPGVMSPPRSSFSRDQGFSPTQTVHRNQPTSGPIHPQMPYGGQPRSKQDLAKLIFKEQPEPEIRLDKVEDSFCVSNYEDVHSSVLAFIHNDEAFKADERNKLAFWQGLCVEVSVVSLHTKHPDAE